MVVVGSAEVTVRAITDRVRADIQRAFADARPDVQAAGNQHGKDYANSFGSGVGSRIQDSLRNALDGSGASKAAGDAGRDAGSNFTKEVEGQLKLFSLEGEGERLGTELGQGMSSRVGQAAGDAGDEAEKALRNAGGRGGNAFKNALDSSFANSAVSASKQFTVLIASSNLLGSAVSVLIGSLSSVVSGLFAMGAAASQAAGALAVIPGVIGAAVQGFGAIKLAFSGVGDAVKAGFKDAVPAIAGTGAAARAAADAVKSAQSSVQSALRGVADAQDTLSRAQQDSVTRSKDARDALVGAYRDAAEAAADAADKVSSAEQRVLTAERDLLAVQKDLNRARAEAAEQLQQLAFSAEGAALAEERAGLRLQDARDRLVAVSTLPPDDRARKDAELSFKEAELAFREAKDRNSDLAKEQSKAAKAGVEGSQSVLDAKDKIAKSENGVIEAEKNLADARKDQSRQQQDSADAIAKAQERVAQVQLQNTRAVSDAQQGVADAQGRLADANAKLADAQKKLNEANTQGSAASDKYKDALAQLSPPAQNFVRFLVSMRDEIKKLKTAAGAGLFPGLQAGLEPIVKNIFPVLTTQLGRTGTLIGTMGRQFGQTIATGEGLKNVTKILGEQNDTLDIFATKGANGKSAIENIALVFTRLGVAIQPITQRFATFLAQLTGTAESATAGQAGMDKLTGFFQRAGDTAAQLGRIFKNLFDIVGGLGKAAQTSGHDLLDSFEEATKKLADFIKLPSTQTDLKEFFHDAAENLKAIGKLVDALGLTFLKLGDNKGVKGFADAFTPAIDNIGKVGDAFTDAGPQLGAFAFQLSELFVNMTQGGAIQKFIENLTAVLKVVNNIVGSDAGKWVLGLAATFAAFTRVAALVLIPVRFIFKALIGGPIGVIKGFQTMLGVFGRIPKAFSVLKGGGGLKAAFAAMSKGSKGAEKAFEEQMVVDKQKTRVLHALEQQALKTAAAMKGVQKTGAPTQAAKGAAASAASSAGSAATGATSAIGGSAASAAEKAVKPAGKLAGAFGKLGSVFSVAGKGLLSFLGPIGLLTIAIPIVITVFKKLYNGNPGFRKFIDGLVEKFHEFVDLLQTKVVPVLITFGKFIGEQFVDKVVPILKVFGQVLKVIFEGIVIAVTFLVKAIKFYITNILIPIFNNILLPIFQVLWKVVKLYIGFVIGYIKVWIDVVKFVISNVLIPLWNNVLLPIFQALWKAAKFAFDIVGKGWDLLVAGLKLAYDVTLKPLIAAAVLAFDVAKAAIALAFKGIDIAWTALKDAFVFIYNKFIAPQIEAVKKGFQTIADKVDDIVGFFKKRWTDLKNDLANIYDKFIAPKIDTVKNKFGEIGKKVGDVVDDVKDFFNDIATGIGSIYDKFISPAIDRVKNGFQNIVTKAGDVVEGVKTAFDKLKDAPADGIKGLVTMLNDNLVHNVNKIGDVFGFHIPDIPIPQFAKGGLVKGRGGPTDDRILARLSNKEFVVNAAATAKNLPELKAMNAGKRIRSGLGVLPVAGWNPFADVKDGVSGLLGQGVGTALEKVIKPFVDKFVPENTYAGKFFRAIVPKLIETMKKWGDKQESSFVPEGSMVGIGGGRSGEYGGVKPWVAAAGDFIKKMFGVTDIGGVGGRPNKSDHPLGYALDFMVYTNKALGDRIANYMLLMRESFKLTYLIWFKKIASATHGWKWRPYTHPNGPTNNRTLLHMDHVHASFRHNVSQKPPIALAAGGLVKATKGGVFAQIAEAGRNERVEPLDREGLSNRDRALVALLQNLVSEGSGRGDTWQVFPAPGMDEVELAEKVSRRVAFKRRTGT